MDGERANGEDWEPGGGSDCRSEGGVDGFDDSMGFSSAFDLRPGCGIRWLTGGGGRVLSTV